MTPPAGDPQEPAGRRVWRNAERFAILGIFVILIGATLIYTRAVAVPVVAAILVGTMVGFLVERLAAHKVPPFASAFLIVGALLLLIYGAALAFSAPLSSWIDRAPEIIGLLRDRFAALREPINALKSVQDSLGSIMGTASGAIAVDVGRSSMLESVIAVATPALSQFFLFLGTLLFFVAGRAQLKRRLVVAFMTREARLTMLRIQRDIEHQLARYLATVTIINVALGVVTAAALWALGVPNAALWGLLACILNYLPFVGPILMAAVLLGVGVITFQTLLWSLSPALVFLVLHAAEGQIITPSIVGRRLTLNPFVVFLSLAFWAWVWGPAGAFMAIPLLVIGIVVTDHLFPRDEIELPG
ncbi:AI-2E family transporter [Chelatococcus reniformis]|uniref:AI-2E family transporter n=1 Tax=Chelatococcus reniformis TaxID=1494448 RepID=A0A916TX94_9HYPH|nr:AI-2E family transporter [Chelatococcus reniformis]GGC46357.1 AI-2E family transporter [Chelatococcus reniformis]